MSARLCERAPQTAGLPAAKKRISLIESDQSKHCVLHLLLDDLHVARMVIQPEQRDSLREKLRRG
jgi:hypothetical protein